MAASERNGRRIMRFDVFVARNARKIAAKCGVVLSRRTNATAWRFPRYISRWLRVLTRRAIWPPRIISRPGIYIYMHVTVNVRDTLPGNWSPRPRFLNVATPSHTGKFNTFRPVMHALTPTSLSLSLCYASSALKGTLWAIGHSC